MTFSLYTMLLNKIESVRMPYYNFQCIECGTVKEMQKRISERDSTETDECPSCSKVGTLNRIVAAPIIGYAVTTPGGYGRIPEGFKEVLKKVHSAPGARQTSSYL